MKKIITIFLIALFISPAVFAKEKFPQPRGYVSDFAGVVSDQKEAEISALIRGVEAKTGVEIAVVTMKTIAPYDIETYAVELFEEWGIGKKGKDNGVLLLVAIGQKRVRIEVGYGLEGVIPDGKAGRIIREAIVPEFRKGDFQNGVLAGVANIVDLVAKEYNVKIDPSLKMPSGVYYVGRPVSVFGRLLRSLFTLLIFILFFGMRFGLFGFLLFGMPRGGYWSGGGAGGYRGGFGGGFGGFGGGLSGGGGASGGW